MSTYKYNNEGDFLTWYKNAYGSDYKGGKLVRPKEMDEASWAAVQELYKGYQGDLPRQKYINDITNRYSNDTQTILQKYASDKNALDETKRTAQQNASITYDKLKKYLPSQIKAQGLSDTGASESAMLEADTHYMNSMGDISATHSKNLTDLNNSRNETIAELERYKNKEISDINKEYDGYLRDAGEDALDAYATKSEEIKQEKDMALTSTIMPELNNLTSEGKWVEALGYLEENKDYFTNPSEYEAVKRKFEEERYKNNIAPDITSGKIDFRDENGIAYRPCRLALKSERKDLPSAAKEGTVVSANKSNFYYAYLNGEWFYVVKIPDSYVTTKQTYSFANRTLEPAPSTKE